MQCKWRMVAIAGMMAVTSIYSMTIEVDVDRVAFTDVRVVEVDARCVEIVANGADCDSLIVESSKVSQGVVIKTKRSEAKLNVWVENEDGRPLMGCVGKLQLAVPRTTSLKLATTTGAVEVSGVRGKALSVQSLSGAITVENCTAAMVLKCTSGNIKLAGCDGTKSVESVSGSISMENCSGDVYAATVSGMLDFEDITGGIEARSVSGMINVETQKGWLELRSVSGALSGEGIDARDSCVFETKSGAITMDFDNPIEMFNFSLKSLSGSLQVDETWATKSLITGNGTITVKGETLSGAQQYE